MKCEGSEYLISILPLHYFPFGVMIILIAPLSDNSISSNVNKNPTDAAVCRYLFTAKLLHMFRVSQHPSSGVLKTVPAASVTGHTTCTATPLQRGLIGTGPDQTTLEGSSGTSSMACNGGCGYSF